jgi:hypothetical protein
MNNISSEQLAAIERLQSSISATVTPAEREKSIRGILNVSKEELMTAPEPPKEKRGRKPTPR